MGRCGRGMGKDGGKVKGIEGLIFREIDGEGYICLA